MNISFNQVDDGDGDHAQGVQNMVRWLERVATGLNLCPCPKGVHQNDQVHYVVCRAQTSTEVLQMLETKLRAVASLPANGRDTTLVVLPKCLNEFLDFNDSLDEPDALLESLDLPGVLQIDRSHPNFRFAGTAARDVSNCTNRAPWPSLHLLREESIDRAVQAFPQADAIFERNVALLKALGTAGCEAVDVGASEPQGVFPAEEA